MLSFPTPKQDIRRAAGDYLIHLKASGRSPATIESYKGSLAVLAESFGPEVTLDALSAHALDAALAGMGGAEGAGGPRRSESTLNRYRCTYKGFFRWAFETSRISKNPAALLRLARGDSPPTPAITAAETKLLLSAIRESGDPLRMRDEALFSTYAFTGLRRAEALRLDVSDYDAGKGVLRVKDGKGRRTRTVPVTQPLGLLLRRFRDGPAARRGGGKLFPGRIQGKALTPREAHARFQRWKKAAGLRPELTIHSFRAGFATALHRGCGDVILVSRALGHSDLRPTLRYVEPHTGRLSRAMEKSFAGIA